ncbi:MAG: VOC family protein [Chloroflexi bacterium]|nr:VOC family protein [Chloroflexota bacterium]
MLSTAHVSFTVEDLERSLGFYRDTLGMELVGRMEAVYFLDPDGNTLELVQRPKG